jgi:hypothetical protein
MMEKLGRRKKREAEAMNPEKQTPKGPSLPITERLAKAGFSINPHKKAKNKKE